MSEDDPSAWLGDPVGSHHTGFGSVFVNVPPAARDQVVISIVDAPELEDRGQAVSAFVRVDLSGARNLKRALGAAIAQLEEHARGDDD